MNSSILKLTVLTVLILTPSICFADASFDSLSPQAQEVAKDIGIVQYIEELGQIKSGLPNDAASKRDPHLLYVRQEMTELLLTTFLETRDAVAELDDQIARAVEIRDLLQSRRDRAIRLNNITNFVSGGAMAMIGSGIQIGTGPALNNGGNMLEVTAGALSTGISTYALKQSGGEKRSAGANPNMLAKMFDLPDTNDRQFPDSLWKYLNNSAAPGAPSRRQTMINRWVSLKRIEPPTSRAGKKHVALLSGAIPQSHSVSIDLLDDRAAMLGDVRTSISQMSRELLEIMHLIRKI